MLMYKMIFRNPNNYQCITGGELYHHGILGQKWGIRRFQKKDGSLTAAGKKRYSEDEQIGSFKRKDGVLECTTKDNILVRVWDDAFMEEGEEVVSNLTKENLDDIINQASKTIKEDPYAEADGIDIDTIKNDLEVYYVSVDKDYFGDGELEISLLPKKSDNSNSIYNLFGDHSIDFDAHFDPKTKQFKLSYWGLNG